MYELSKAENGLLVGRTICSEHEPNYNPTSEGLNFCRCSQYYIIEKVYLETRTKYKYQYPASYAIEQLKPFKDMAEQNGWLQEYIDQWNLALLFYWIDHQPKRFEGEIDYDTPNQCIAVITKMYTEEGKGLHTELHVGWDKNWIDCVENANVAPGFSFANNYTFMVELRKDHEWGPFHFMITANNLKGGPHTQKFEDDMELRRKNYEARHQQ